MISSAAFSCNKEEEQSFPLPSSKRPAQHVMQENKKVTVGPIADKQTLHESQIPTKKAFFPQRINVNKTGNQLYIN